MIAYNSMYTAEVKRNSSESSTSLLRRFTKRVQSSNVLKKSRNNKYSERPLSALKKKKNALKKISKRAEIEHLKKLGKIKEPTYGRR